jgi:hypothetical protein
MNNSETMSQALMMMVAVVEPLVVTIAANPEMIMSDIERKNAAIVTQKIGQVLETFHEWSKLEKVTIDGNMIRNRDVLIGFRSTINMYLNYQD